MAAQATSLKQTSEFILEKVGGAENVASLSHCATRLRFQLFDQSKADQAALDANPEVLGVVPQGTTGLQVVMGGAVANYYQELVRMPGMGEKDENSASSKKQYSGVRGKYSKVDYCFEFLSDTFRPILWALLGASLIITLLVLFDTFGLAKFPTGPEAGDQFAALPAGFQLMHAMWKSVFYFLPIMVGATAARKLGANEWVGAAIPAAFLTPDFLAIGNKGDVVQVFGASLVLNDYGGQVFPPLIAAIGLFWVEKGLKKIIPSSIQMVFVPFFSLLVMIPATAFVLGPFGIGVGNGITSLLTAVNGFSPFILAIIIPCLYPFLVPLGLHWPLNAIMIQNIAVLGYDFIQGPMGAWNFACFGVVTGVFITSLMERNTAMRQVSFGGMMAGLLGGISEPSLYGVLLRFRKSYIRLLAGCVAGGIVMGIFDVKAHAFVFTSLLTIPAMSPYYGYAIGIAVAFFTSMTLVILFDYRTKDEKAEVLAQLAAAREQEEEAKTPLVAAAATPTAETAAKENAVAVAEETVKTALQPGAVSFVSAPLDGEIVPLSEVPDPIFATAKLGKGVAIKPTGTQVVAPAAGTVIAVQKSGHAVGLRLDNGIELLVHVGIDTVQLGGEGFEVHVARKQRVEAGDVLITFEPKFIESKGYNLITPVLVTNTTKFAEVEGVAEGVATTSTEVIKTTA
ncbi:glucose PTS transporter subunit IIA [Corynebacterium felinum]|uniref:PTS system beta-glucosides-specific IIC component n=1 Tax=Corynebacterium felinum TaxID=131318 RepID=A0ABU2BA24_9CORY|nr:glucose PTS transporter subunit IIA [Corynebacterium felinum]MDF5820449.1 glucose PTS transporter subunit IIA [Corynebacterium felinum]MDR7355487.1 PTS system beta-glucosides-specific IIC component [Corynebacterium felinum]WJY94838.1 PTS system beta-glucoside-specific EIIBCA component [Corynebacterium felinum]